MVTIPTSLQPRLPSKPQTIAQQRQPQQTFQQAPQELPQDIKNRLDKVVKDLEEGRVLDKSQIPSDLIPFLDIPADYFKKAKEYSVKLKTYQSTQRELAEWKQAESYVFSVTHGGKSIRYDPSSSYGIKVNKLFKNLSLARKSIEYTQQRYNEQEALRKSKAGELMVSTKEGYIVEPKMPTRTDVFGMPISKAEEVFSYGLPRKQGLEKPQPLVMDVQPGITQRIKEEVGELRLKSRQAYGYVFEKKPNMEPLTTRKVAGEVTASTLGRTGRAIQLFGDTLSEIPTREREYEEGEIFRLTPRVSDVPLKETVTYGEQTLSPAMTLEKERILEELVPETIFEEKAQEIVNITSAKYYKILQEEATTIKTEKDLNKLINKINKEADYEINKEIKNLNKEYQTEFTKREQDRIDKYIKISSSIEFWKRAANNVIRAGLYTVPYYGGALLTTDIARGIKEAPETRKFAYKYPSEFRKELASSLLIFGGVGYSIGKLKSASYENKVSEAISKGILELKSAGKLKETQINAFKITPEMKMELTKLLDKGHSVKIYQIKLKAKQGLEKHTPKLDGTYIEVVNSQGDLIRRTALGKFTAKLKGKTIEKYNYGEAISKVNKETGGVEGYSEFIDLPIKKPAIGVEGGWTSAERKGTIYKYYEESKPVSTKRKGDTRIIESESVTSALGTDEYTGGNLLKRYGITKDGLLVLPDYEVLKAKGVPITKAEFIEMQRLIKIKGDVLVPDTGISLLKVEKEFDTFGLGTSEKIIPEVKPSQKALRWKFKEEIEPKVSYDKPSPFKPGEVSAEELIAPLYIKGGEVGRVQQSLYHGQSFIVPSDYSSAGNIMGGAFARLPGDLSGGFGVGFSVTGLSLGLFKGSVSPAISDRIISDVKTEVKVKGEYGMLELEKEREGKIFSGLFQPTRTIYDTKDTTVTKESLISSSVMAQASMLKQEQQQQQKQKLIQKGITSPIISKPTSPPTSPKIRFRIPLFFEGEEDLMGQQTGYHAFVKENRKYKQVSTKPLTRMGAKDIGAKYTDNTTSATFKIKPITETEVKDGKKASRIKLFKEKELGKGDNYFNKVSKKFRPFSIIKGRPVAESNLWIEKKINRTDTKGERKGLSIAKFRKQLSKKDIQFPNKKTKGKTIKRFFSI